jgi:hypothetical protein
MFFFRCLISFGDVISYCDGHNHLYKRIASRNVKLEEPRLGASRNIRAEETAG